MENTTQTQEITMVSKIVPKMIGNAKKAAALDTIGETVTLGKVFGMATGIKQIEDQMKPGTFYYPLVGRFEAHTSKGEILRSGKLFLPGGIHESYEQQARALEDGEQLAFALELRAVKDGNAAGYTYRAIDLMPRKASDPLDDFSQLVLNGGKKSAPSLPAETADVEVVKPTPAPVKGGKK